MRTGRAARKNRTVLGFDGNRLEVGLLGLDEAGDTRNRAARPDARNDRVDCAIRIIPDLMGRRIAMHFGVGGISELLRHVGVLDRLREFRCQLDRSTHSLRAVGQHDLGAKGAHRSATFRTHRVGHDDHTGITLDRRDQRKCDAGIPARRLDDRGFSRDKITCLLGGFDHRQTDSILDTVSRIGRLHFCENRRVAIPNNTIESNKRSSAHQIRHVRCNFHFCRSPRR